MWLVRIALLRPYTFIVFAMLLLILGLLSILKTPTDIFPNIRIPVVSVVWSYTGLPPDEMANRMTAIFERAVTTTVNDIEHIESQSLIGVSVTKLFFQPGVDIAVALAEVTAIAQTILKTLPPGATPPLVLSYNASTVPVMQLVLSSNSIPEQKLNDLGNNYIRTQLATVQGAALPYPYGGKVRQVSVDIDSKAMQTYGVSAQNVNDAINSQSIITPAGTQKMGMYEYIVKLNNSPLKIETFNHLPVKYTPNRILYISDVAHVRDGFAPQTNIVRVNGERAVMMSIEKTGSASTLNIINRVKAMLPIIKDNLPDALKLGIFGDQSIFVTAAIKGVITEAVTAAALTGLMILIFLGSLQSTFIITVSIPLSILASISILSFLGETINIMTLGGLALAVGILVDDATVTIENINWNLEQGKEIRDAILDGAKQIAIPTLVSTLCICIVFIPMFYLGGVAQYLFVPLAEAVIFAMLSSYFLSRTLVPTLAQYLLASPDKNKKNSVTTPSPLPLVGEGLGVRGGCITQPPSSPTLLPQAGEGSKQLQNNSRLAKFHANFEKKFDALRERYQTILSWVLQNSMLFIYSFLGGILVLLISLGPWLGSNFFPSIDAGQIKLHIRAPTGTRVEETARLADQIDHIIREIIPEKELDSLIDNIGLPVSGINLSYSNSATVGPEDVDILISLKSSHHPSEYYIHELRHRLKNEFPGVNFAFLPADIVNQILNFGLPSPINIQITGSRDKQNEHYAKRLLDKLAHIPGVVDVRTRQANNYPELFINVDRSRAKELGFTQLDVVRNLYVSLSGSFQTTPNFWVDPDNDVSYPIVTQTPQYAMYSLQTLRNIPMTNLQLSSPPQILGAIADIQRKWVPVVVSHYNVQPVIDIFAGTQDRDLGSITHDIQQLIKETHKDLPKGSQIFIRGQIETQSQAFTGLYLGLLFSVLLIYLLIVVNFQSWIDPFIIITALPAAMAGIAFLLFITHTTLSVPALTGAIMCMGVATANSILVISFARDHMKAGNDPMTSALEAGISRLRPVMMTALAMIIGMFPMALGLGEGGEQNAPLGRAVIGGLSFATIATLFFVPAVFYTIHNWRQRKHENDH